MENDTLNNDLEFIESDDISNYSDDNSEYIDSENTEDISDVYSDEVIEEILNEKAAADGQGDTSPGLGTAYDDTNLRLQLDEFTDSFSVFSDSVSEKLDKMTSINIALLVLVTGFVVINIFRKLFDWIG